jgi:uncharacterized surface protein with fasciclin (FAS1) repeats
MRSTRLAVAAAALALPLTLAACGTDDGASSTDPATSAAPSSATPSETMSAASAGGTFGAGCAAVPTSGDGSFDGMAMDPVATAASNNPVLSTLVSAVEEAGLVDTLNSAEDITVFAPTDDAFGEMDQDTLDQAMADPEGLLTTVLTNHVVEGRLGPDQLDGEHETLAGTTLTVSGSGEEFTVDDQAMVVCGNVETANATVYIIDGVLLPES